MAKYEVSATFFVVGAWVDKYPESVKALHDSGHEVMNHSNDHAHFNPLDSDSIAENVNACNDKIEAVTGVRPTLFRPPYGEYNDNVVQTLTDMQMYTIQWDVETLHRIGVKLETIDAQRIVAIKKPSEHIALRVFCWNL